MWQGRPTLNGRARSVGCGRRPQQRPGHGAKDARARCAQRLRRRRDQRAPVLLEHGRDLRNDPSHTPHGALEPLQWVGDPFQGEPEVELLERAAQGVGQRGDGVARRVGAVLEEGVAVTQGHIDEQVANYTGQAGGEQAMEDMFIQENVAPSQIESFIKLQIQAQDLGIKLD